MADPNTPYYLLAESPRMASWTAPMAAKFRRVGISGYSPENPNPFSHRDASLFCEIIQAYTTRSLTYPDDVLRAMAGIMRFYEQRASYTFLEGVPTELFDAITLFRSNGCTLRRRRGYPSYSWAGWTGRVRFSGLVTEGDVAANRWLNDSCPISWHAVNPNEPALPKPIWEPDLWEKVRGPRQALLRKWVERLCNHIKAGASAAADDASHRTPDQDNLLSTETADIDMPDPSELSLLQRREDPQVRYKFLQFWAISVYLRIEARNIFTGTVWIMTEDGEKVGVAWVDGIEDTALLGSSKPVEFILVSAVSPLRRESAEDEAWAFGNPVYDVLFLHRSDPASVLSERRGVGLLAEPGVRKSVPPGPRLTEIILG